MFFLFFRVFENTTDEEDPNSFGDDDSGEFDEKLPKKSKNFFFYFLEFVE